MGVSYAENHTKIGKQDPQTGSSISSRRIGAHLCDYDTPERRCLASNPLVLRKAYAQVPTHVTAQPPISTNERLRSHWDLITQRSGCAMEPCGLDTVDDLWTLDREQESATKGAMGDAAKSFRLKMVRLRQNRK